MKKINRLKAKSNVLQVCGYKNYDRKTDGTQAKPIYFYYFFCVVGWAIISQGQKKKIYFLPLPFRFAQGYAFDFIVMGVVY
ncbi:MAG: hypothetical protein IPM95_00090 [Sphingobacteriales bacterium]|nr:hypothetical protein [Sphingobacteriales bacterium]MBK9327717.1 hypothetical protein [Sphingobacteriales bacterium]